MVNILGIESTAHTFGAAVICESEILSNVKDAITTESGGMIPYHIAVHHVGCCQHIIRKALAQAHLTIQDIEGVAFSQAPGIGHALRIGAQCARTIALQQHIPLFAVHHSIAHLEIGHLLSDASDPILCYVSGANTQIIALESGKYRIFGETLDIGIGHLLDTVARIMGLGFPGGPLIADLAKQSTEFIELPYSVKGMDVNFGGLQTKIKELLSSGVTKEAIAFSVQETVFAMIVEVTERAVAHCTKKEVLLGGGVACNERLQEMMRLMCEARGAQCFVLPNQYNVDNAAMIAYVGLRKFKKKDKADILASGILPYQRVDEVRLTWH